MPQNAYPQWRTIGPQNNFNATPSTPTGTFAQNWNPRPGHTLEADFNAAMAAMDQVMGASYPNPEEDDLMNAVLLNWPDATKEAI